MCLVNGIGKPCRLLGHLDIVHIATFYLSIRNEQSGKRLHVGDICKMSSCRLVLATVPSEAVTLLTQQILDKPGKLGSSNCLIFVALPIFADSNIWKVNQNYTFHISVSCLLLVSPEDCYSELAAKGLLF